MEEEWSIDMAGLSEAAVDAEGWSHAVDFSWLHNPPVPGAGRFKRVRAGALHGVLSHAYSCTVDDVCIV